METKDILKKHSRSPQDQHWKDSLASRMPQDWALEVDEFETEIFLKKNKKIEDKVFAETRLRRGVYGQRYDNGKRHDGKAPQPIPFPCGDGTKGPDTVWDAPGMLRIKIPYGGMTVEQLEVIAECAEEYSDSIIHITTRQDVQIHFVHIEDMPSIFRRLAAVGITTKEACGNSVRNVTGCPLAGACHTESFDITPYSDALFRYFLGHPDIQDFGRKFKISFSGCKHKPCALANMHDLGLIAVKKNIDGAEKRGFEFYVGGGLGAVPHSAKLLSDFVPEEELLPLTQAVCRIYARYGEKQKRNRARIKFLVNDWGIEKFKQFVFDERKVLAHDPRWTEYLKTIPSFEEKPKLAVSGKKVPANAQGDYARWLKNNVETQKQEGYNIVHISLPLGDLTSNQARDLVDICKKYIDNTVRTTVEQNIILRWVRDEDLEALYTDLKKIGLSESHAGTIVDITSCPGTDTCKLGVSASRGLAGELRHRLAEKAFQMDEAIQKLKIKISGCFNSCSQHYVADIGFYGISRKVGNYLVPHFQLVLGGQWEENGGSYGMAVVGIPSKAIPATVDRLAELYLKGKQNTENFQQYVKRVGKVELKKALQDLTEVPTHEENPFYYKDWGTTREFTTSDIGVGECAGEVISLVDFGLKAADRLGFEALVSLDKEDYQEAAKKAFKAMVTAAAGLIKGTNPDIGENSDTIISEFKRLFCDTKVFYDPFAGDKFANFLFKAQKEGTENVRDDQVRQRVEEAQLFIEAAYSCHARMSMQKGDVLM